MYSSQQMTTNITPLLEKRRIVGSLRERTVYIPVNPNHNNYFNDSQNGFFCNNSNEMMNGTYFDDRDNMKAILFEIEKRINEHIEKKIEVYDDKIDFKIKKIDDKIKEIENQQISIERRIRKVIQNYHKNKSHNGLKKMICFSQIPHIETQSSIW